MTVTYLRQPVQFGAGEDLDHIPGPCKRTSNCVGNGRRHRLHPAVADVYRRPPLVTINPGVLGTELEVPPGRAFRGMLTVVFKLLQLTRPRRLLR